MSTGHLGRCAKGLDVRCSFFFSKGALPASYIAPNVGLVTANHVLTDLEQHQPGKDIVLGKNCWIGMNSTVLPGVVLGDHTVVGAGSVVTKSFPEGWQVIAGNPAKMIRKLEKPTENENQNKTIV